MRARRPRSPSTDCSRRPPLRFFFGIYETGIAYETLTFCGIDQGTAGMPPPSRPAQYHDGRCRRGHAGEMPSTTDYGLCQGRKSALTPSSCPSHREYGYEAGTTHRKLRVPVGAGGRAGSCNACFSELEDAVNAARFRIAGKGPVARSRQRVSGPLEGDQRSTSCRQFQRERT